MGLESVNPVLGYSRIETGCSRIEKKERKAKGRMGKDPGDVKA